MQAARSTCADGTLGATAGLIDVVKFCSSNRRPQNDARVDRRRKVDRSANRFIRNTSLKCVLDTAPSALLASASERNSQADQMFISVGQFRCCLGRLQGFLHCEF